jgi:hypothetical protein
MYHEAPLRRSPNEAELRGTFRSGASWYISKRSFVVHFEAELRGTKNFSANTFTFQEFFYFCAPF